MKRFEVILNLISSKSSPVGAEIGVCDGVFTEFLLNNKNDLTMYSIDPYVFYEPYYHTGERQHSSENQSFFDTQYIATKEKLSVFGDRSNLMRTTSKKAADTFSNFSLDFVFIDGNHLYNYVKEDILSYFLKIKAGGILAGHDYNKNSEEHLNNTCKVVDSLFTKDVLYFGDDSTWWVYL